MSGHASPRHRSPLGALQGEGSCDLPSAGLPGFRWSCVPGLASTPQCAKEPCCLLANSEEPLCRPRARWLVLATSRAPRCWGRAASHWPGCHPPPGVPAHLGGSGRQGNHSTPGSVALCLPFFSFCFVRCNGEVAGAELFTLEAKHFLCCRK